MQDQKLLSLAAHQAEQSRDEELGLGARSGESFISGDMEAGEENLTESELGFPGYHDVHQAQTEVQKELIKLTRLMAELPLEIPADEVAKYSPKISEARRHLLRVGVLLDFYMGCVKLEYPVVSEGKVFLAWVGRIFHMLKNDELRRIATNNQLLQAHLEIIQAEKQRIETWQGELRRLSTLSKNNSSLTDKQKTLLQDRKIEQRELLVKSVRYQTLREEEEAIRLDLWALRQSAQESRSDEHEKLRKLYAKWVKLSLPSTDWDTIRRHVLDTLNADLRTNLLTQFVEEESAMTQACSKLL